MRKPFTEYAIKRLRPKAVRYEVFSPGEDGFGIRVSETGRKSWLTRYRRRTQLVKITHGQYPGVSLAEARARHRECRNLLHRGVDPALKFHAERQQEKEAGTVAELAKEYIEHYAKERKRSWPEDQRILAKDILPAWRHRKVKDIIRRDIVRLLDRIKARGAPVGANRTLALLTTMFRFAVRRGIIQASPCVEIERPAKETERERILKDHEIHAVWEKLPEADMAPMLRLAIKLLLITGQRRGEVAGAPWTEFNLANRVWNIPSTRTKNENPHSVPLTDLALEVLQEIHALNPESDYLFPSLYGDKSIPHRAVTRAISNNQDVFGIPHWTAHDLRRTAATGMTELVDPKWVERVLNHLPPKIVRTYDRHDYMREKRQALEKWARKLKAILEGKVDKVITLRG